MGGLQLGDELLAVAGDWHGDVRWVQRAIPALRRAAPGVSTLLHLGDFGIWPGPKPGFLGAVDYWCRRSGIERVLVTPGNHDDWDQLQVAFAAAPGEAARLSEAVWALPRGYRFRAGGRSLLSFGGAASIDRVDRVAGRTWWAAEMPTDADVAAATSSGMVDILLTHDAPTEIVSTLSSVDLSSADRAYVLSSSDRVSEVWRATNAAVLAHGHLHRKGTHRFPGERVVFSLAAERDDGNLALLDLASLAWTWVNVAMTGQVRLILDRSEA